MKKIKLDLRYLLEAMSPKFKGKYSTDMEMKRVSLSPDCASFNDIHLRTRISRNVIFAKFIKFRIKSLRKSR